MKYTKEQRLAIAEAFRQARLRIAKEKNTHICSALAEGVTGEWRGARDVIVKRMGGDPDMSLAMWLDYREFATLSWFINDTKGREQIRLYRLRWLDALIKEFSK